jgi:hypothetical protein
MGESALQNTLVGATRAPTEGFFEFSGLDFA